MLQPFKDRPERVNTGIRLPIALYQRVRAEARRRGLSVNRFVEWVLESWFKGPPTP